MHPNDADVAQLVAVRAQHAKLAHPFLPYFGRGFLDFLTRAPLHEQLGLDRTEGLVLVKSHNLAHKFRPVNEKVQVHSQVVLRLKRAVKPIEQGTLPDHARVLKHQIAVRQRHRKYTESAVTLVTSLALLMPLNIKIGFGLGRALGLCELINEEVGVAEVHEHEDVSCKGFVVGNLL